MSDVVDLVEQSRDALDDVWRQTDFEPYPETRMVRLMDVIGASLGTCQHEPQPGNENLLMFYFSMKRRQCHMRHMDSENMHVLEK